MRQGPKYPMMGDRYAERDLAKELGSTQDLQHLNFDILIGYN